MKVLFTSHPRSVAPHNRLKAKGKSRVRERLHRTAVRRRTMNCGRGILLKKLPPLEQVRPIRRQICVLYKFQETTFRVASEDGSNTLANGDRSFADQINLMLLEPGNDLMHVRDHEGDIGNALALKHPVGSHDRLKRDIFGLNQLDSLPVRCLQTNDSKAIRASAEFCAHLWTGFGIGGEFEPQNLGVESE